MKAKAGYGENNIGRGEAFWQSNFELLQKKFPQQFNKISVPQFFKGINKVQPSLIRTEADEVTYHFHVMIRYEIEKLLIEGSISAKDIPAYWNEHYQKYLGVTVPDDVRGCLQDVHWSHGSLATLLHTVSEACMQHNLLLPFNSSTLICSS
jgi:carboxypeptidase Taq